MVILPSFWHRTSKNLGISKVSKKTLGGSFIIHDELISWNLNPC